MFDTFVASKEHCKEKPYESGMYFAFFNFYVFLRFTSWYYSMPLILNEQIFFCVRLYIAEILLIRRRHIFKQSIYFALNWSLSRILHLQSQEKSAHFDIYLAVILIKKTVFSLSHMQCVWASVFKLIHESPKHFLPLCART